MVLSKSKVSIEHLQEVILCQLIGTIAALLSVMTGSDDRNRVLVPFDFGTRRRGYYPQSVLLCFLFSLSHATVGHRSS